jgi:hypothetical protein
MRRLHATEAWGSIASHATAQHSTAQHAAVALTAHQTSLADPPAAAAARI